MSRDEVLRILPTPARFAAVSARRAALEGYGIFVVALLTATAGLLLPAAGVRGLLAAPLWAGAALLLGAVAWLAYFALTLGGIAAFEALGVRPGTSEAHKDSRPARAARWTGGAFAFTGLATLFALLVSPVAWWG